MHPSISEFIEFLDQEDDTDFGDFKREVDLRLVRLIDNLRPLNGEQVWQLRKMREQLLWSYKFDIEEMRSLLRSEAQHLDVYNNDLQT